MRAWRTQVEGDAKSAKPVRPPFGGRRVDEAVLRVLFDRPDAATSRDVAEVLGIETSVATPKLLALVRAGLATSRRGGAAGLRTYAINDEGRQYVLRNLQR
jgi:DNA-binding MarR family transcriptional regulator